MATDEYLNALARRLHSIARDCFDLGTMERLRLLADELEQQATARSRALGERNNVADDGTET